MSLKHRLRAPEDETYLYGRRPRFENYGRGREPALQLCSHGHELRPAAPPFAGTMQLRGII